MGKTLSIETGIRCNNRCSFCYQSQWRCREASLPDPDTETLLEKLRWGRENGYDAVGFSGGEPTLRADFLKLVRSARELGYRSVGLTTNGRRFSNSVFAAAALSAGLTGIGWSLHGPNPEIHDDLVGRKGAFQQSVRGIQNVARICKCRDTQVDQNLFILVNRRNVEHVLDTCVVGRRLGIRLFIVQPIIFSKGNLSSAAQLQAPLPAVVRSVRKVAMYGRKGRWSVKLFNLPPCLFSDMLERFEHQQYPVRVFRLQESEEAGESRQRVPNGFVRMQRCGECLVRAFCPGLHQSLLSQRDLLSLFLDSLQLPPGSDEAWLTGLEMFQPETLATLVQMVKKRTKAPLVKVYYGGDSVAGEQYLPAVVRGGATHITYLVRGFEPRTDDISRKGSGNLDQLVQFASHPLWSDPVPLGRSIAAPLVDTTRLALMERLAGLPSLRGWGLEIDLPSDFKSLNLHDIPKWTSMAWRWHRLGGDFAKLVVPRGSPAASRAYRWSILPLMRTVEAHRHFVTHRFAEPFGEWASLTVPHYLDNRDQSEKSEDEPMVNNLMGSHIDAAALERIRKTFG